jgi:signal transduction histidine kinase
MRTGGEPAQQAGRTPGYLEYLTTEVPQAIQQNLEGLSQITRMVGSLREFSHAQPAGTQPVDLNHLVETAVTISHHEWRYEAELTTQLDPDLPPIPAVADELSRVLLNLIVNAVHAITERRAQAGGERGRICIRTQREGERARIEVEDNGTGIEPRSQPHIFEPFYTTKPVGRGTGQGLAMVHAIVVRHHQGNIDFVTEAGRGTTFRIWLPLK